MITREIAETQRRQFENDGVLVLRNALSPEDIEKLKHALDAQISDANASLTAYDFEKIAAEIWNGAEASQNASQRFDVAALSAAIRNDPTARPLRETLGEADTGFFLFEASGWRQHRAIREIALDSQFPEMAAALLGTPIVSFWDDTTFVKGPQTKQKTAFHQDLGYNNYDGENALVFWAPVDRATEESGVTKYVRGSHKVDTVYAPNLFISQTPMPGSAAPKCPDIEADESTYDVVCFDVDPGDVIVHHIKTLHGAGGNCSDRMRRAISFHYCGADARYIERPGSAPRLHDVDVLTPGDPICSRDHPVVWPRAWPQLKLASLVVECGAAQKEHQIPSQAA